MPTRSRDGRYKRFSCLRGNDGGLSADGARGILNIRLSDAYRRDQFSTVCNMLDLSTGIGEIAATTGLSRQTIYRIRDDRASAEAALANWAA
jgi:hypothetical protein